MSQVLYRKYRAKNFGSVFGQDTIVRVLKQSIKEKKVGHAYLFSGPRGTGKTSMARILAKAVNCQNSVDGDACAECSSCEAIAAGRYLDLVEIDAASNRGIDEIRDLKEKVNFLPTSGKYKVYIIDEVHMLTNEAFNALLKTLEEPPAQVMFILATTEIHKVPATVMSRTQRFDFKLASAENLRQKLELIVDAEGVKIDSAGIDLIIEGAKGSYRDAESILEKLISTVDKKKKVSAAEVADILGYVSGDLVAKMLQALLNDSPSQASDTLKAVQDNGASANQFLLQLIELARKMLVEDLNADNRGRMGKIGLIIKELIEAANLQRSVINPFLPIELAAANVFGSSFVAVAAAPTNNPPNPSTPEVKQVPPAAPKAVAALSQAEKVTQPKEEKKAPEKLVEEVQSVVSADIGDISAKWPHFIGKIKSVNHYLATFLVNAQILSVDGNSIKLAVAFAFHKKKLEDKKSADLLEVLSKEIFGRGYIFICEVKDMAISQQNDVKSNKDLVEDLLL